MSPGETTRVRWTAERPPCLLLECNRRSCEGDMRLAFYLRHGAICALCGRWRLLD